jgi:hypothetical protein
MKFLVINRLAGLAATSSVWVLSCTISRGENAMNAKKTPVKRKKKPEAKKLKKKEQSPARTLVMRF